MKITELIRQTQECYKDAIISEREQKISSKIGFAQKDTAKEKEKKIEKLKDAGVSSDVIDSFTSSYDLELKEYNKILNSLSFGKDPIKVNKVNTDKYISAVESFSSNGGTGFYDLGSIVSVKYKEDVEEFKKQIKKLQESGLDIRILVEDNIGNEERSEYRSESRFAIAMPSSAYHEYESMMVKNFAEEMYDTQSPALRKNFFIPPLIESRNEIEKILKIMTDEVKLDKKDSKHENVDRYIFSAFGYSTVDLDTKGGYGVFDTYNPDVKALKNSVEKALHSASIYDNTPRHSNSMMPTLICYSQKEKAARGLDMDKKQRFTIENGLKGYEAENPKKELKRKSRNRP